MSAEVRAESPTGIVIDLMRGLLAIMVLAAHSLGAAWEATGGTSATWLKMTLGHGGFWVEGFFVLSGFCVHQSIAGMRRRGGEFIKPYAFARVSRIYPLYAVALLLTFFAWSVFGPMAAADREGAATGWLSHALMMQGITGVFHETAPAWSLTYEAIYYAAWPMLLILCGWSVGRAFVFGVIGALALAALNVIIWRKVVGGAADSTWIPLWLIPAQFLLWVGGALLAHAWDKVQSFRLPALAPLSLVALLGCYVAQAWLLHHGARQWMLLVVAYAALPCWLGLIAGAGRWKTAPRWSAVAKVAGLLSYPLYILHQLGLDVLARLIPSAMKAWSPETLALLFFAVVLSVVLIAGVPLEAQLLKWRAQWLRGTRKSSATQAMREKLV